MKTLFRIFEIPQSGREWKTHSECDHTYGTENRERITYYVQNSDHVEDSSRSARAGPYHAASIGSHGMILMPWVCKAVLRKGPRHKLRVVATRYLATV